MTLITSRNTRKNFSITKSNFLGTSWNFKTSLYSFNPLGIYRVSVILINGSRLEEPKRKMSNLYPEPGVNHALNIWFGAILKWYSRLSAICMYVISRDVRSLVNFPTIEVKD